MWYSNVIIHAMEYEKIPIILALKALVICMENSLFMHTSMITPRGESPSYLSNIYVPYLFFMPFSWPTTHHNNFHIFGSILNRNCFSWHNISVVSSSMCHALNFVLRKIKYWDYFSHFLIEAKKLILSENQINIKACMA